MTTVLVTGATGFIGGRLVPALVDAGHTVRAMTRRPEDYSGVGDPVGADVDDPASLVAALDGVDVAVYLVPSLDDPDFERKDAEAARNFSRAATDAGGVALVARHHDPQAAAQPVEHGAHPRSTRTTRGPKSSGDPGRTLGSGPGPDLCPRVAASSLELEGQRPEKPAAE